MFSKLFFIMCFSLSLPAFGNSRFKVVNDSENRVDVYIYNGSDQSCLVTAKEKTVPPGETKSFGCAGEGNQRCKVKIKKRSNSQLICEYNHDTCWSNSKQAYLSAKVANGEKITIDDDMYCEITD